MRVLALDQATVLTGWAIIDDGLFKKSGVINCSREIEHDIMQRSQWMMKEISSVIDKSLADVIVIEDVQHQSNSSIFKHLARLQGMIIGYCLTYQYRFMIISPSTWRTTIKFDMGKSIRRNNLKLQAIEFVYNRYQRHVKDDEAEAICMATAAYEILKKEEEENALKAKREESQSQSKANG